VEAVRFVHHGSDPLLSVGYATDVACHCTVRNDSVGLVSGQ
jgi:hypothetical protein